MIKIFVLILGLLAAVPSVNAEYLSASGCSVSNVGYLLDLAHEYERRTGTKVLVRGGGSVLGLADLESGRVDFAASCRNKTEGDPEDIEFIQVAWDALVMIAHKSNPTSDISLANIRAIYFAQITNWKQLGGKDAPIKLFMSRPKAGLSGLESSIRTFILKGKDPIETKNTLFLPSTGIVEQMVESTPDGFATAGFSSARKRNIKILKVNGVYPTKDAISGNKYPFRRPLFLVIHKNPKPEVKKFIDYALSKEGQHFISSLGIVSLLDVK